jgi:hypothetical protein
MARWRVTVSCTGDNLELFRFIDCVLTLPAELEQRFWTELAQFEEERHMPYVTSVERMGIEQGIQQGEIIMLTQFLSQRFGPLPAWVLTQRGQASRPTLERWAGRVFDAQHLEDVFADE